MLVVRKIGEQVDEYGVRRCVLQDKYGGTILATYTEIAEEIRAGELKFADSQEEIGKVKKPETQRKEHMIKVKCISKNRDSKGVIQSYTLQDVKGTTMNVTGQQIKQAIAKGQIEIVNLQIDRAGRLIDKSETKVNVNVSRQLINKVEHIYFSEIQGIGTGAYLFPVREIKKHCEEEGVTLNDIIRALPEDMQHNLYKAFIIFSAECSYAKHNIKQDIIELTNREGEVAGKLAAYLVKKYNDTNEYKVVTQCHDAEYYQGGPIVSIIDRAIYTRKPKGKTIEKVDWSNFLGNIREARYSFGGIDIWFTNKENGYAITGLDVIYEKNKVNPFDYHRNLGDNVMAFIIKEGHSELSRDTMFNVISKLSKQLDEYGITAEVYSKSGKGFIKLYCEQ